MCNPGLDLKEDIFETICWNVKTDYIVNNSMSVPMLNLLNLIVVRQGLKKSHAACSLKSPAAPSPY